MFHCSLNGYSRPSALSQINEDDIENMEQFAREELIHFIQHKHPPTAKMSIESYTEFFLGVFAFNASKFRFLPGEKYLIKELAKYVKSKNNDNNVGEDFSYFESKQPRAISSKNTTHFPCGLFFGKHLDSNNSTIEKNDIAGAILAKIKSWFTDQYADSIIANLIQIKNTGRALQIKYTCMHCNVHKSMSIQCGEANGRLSWNASNVKKHYKRVHKHMLILIDNKVDTSESTNGDEQDEEMPEINEMPPNNLSENMNKIFHQMQEQSLAMTSTVLMNNELSEDIIFMIDREELQIKVTKISSDGNCLFGAVAHQLYHIKVDSHEHIEKNAALRSCVVAHIKKNIRRYEHALQGRVLDENENIDNGKRKKQPTLRCMKKKREHILNELSKDTYWGGMESLQAVSEIFEVNILIFNEHGPVYFMSGFQSTYNKTICLAFRLGGEGDERNHYDSVSCIESDNIYKCAERLGDLADKSDLLLDSSHISIVE